MAVDYNSLVGASVSFQLYAPAVLGAGYNFVTVIGVVSSNVAISFGDIVSLHAQVYSSLPAGTLNDYTSYDYLLIRNANNQILPIGVPWISGQIAIATNSQTTITIPNLSAAQQTELQYVLSSNGFTGFSISTTTLS